MGIVDKLSPGGEQLYCFGRLGGAKLLQNPILPPDRGGAAVPKLPPLVQFQAQFLDAASS